MYAHAIISKSATVDEVRKHGYVPTPGHYSGAEAQEGDSETLEEKVARLVAALREQQSAATRLNPALARNLAAPECTESGCVEHASATPA